MMGIGNTEKKNKKKGGDPPETLNKKSVKHGMVRIGELPVKLARFLSCKSYGFHEAFLTKMIIF